MYNQPSVILEWTIHASGNCMSISINSTCCRCSAESTYLTLLFLLLLIQSLFLFFSLHSVYVTVGIQYSGLTTCSCHWEVERVALILRATLFHEVKVLVVPSCLTLWAHMNCSLQGSSVYGIFQARILEWVAISFSSGSSWPRVWTPVSFTAGKFCIVSDTREAYRVSLLNWLSFTPSQFNKVKAAWNS